MVKIPIGPDHLGERAQEYSRGSLFDTLWKIVVSIMLAVILYVALSSAVGLITTIAGIAAGYLLADDVAAVISDIWNRDFLYWRVD